MGGLTSFLKNRRVVGCENPYGSEAMFRPGQGGEGRREGWGGEMGGLGRGGVEGERALSPSIKGLGQGTWLPVDLLESIGKGFNGRE